MEYILESHLFEEYRNLRDILNNDEKIINLISKRNQLNEELRNIESYSDKYKQIKELYDIVSYQLNDEPTYKHFKVMERELNMFVMYCNKELNKLFGLDKKECGK